MGLDKLHVLPTTSTVMNPMMPNKQNCVDLSFQLLLSLQHCAHASHREFLVPILQDLARSGHDGTLPVFEIQNANHCCNDGRANNSTKNNPRATCE